MTHSDVGEPLHTIHELHPEGVCWRKGGREGERERGIEIGEGIERVTGVLTKIPHHQLLLIPFFSSLDQEHFATLLNYRTITQIKESLFLLQHFLVLLLSSTLTHHSMVPAIPCAPKGS